MSVTPLRAHTADPVEAPDDGHGAGTAPKKAGGAKGNRRTPDRLSLVRAIVPRLLGLEEAATYLGLSFWSFRELVNAGDVPLIRVPRPKTMRQHKRRTKGQAKGEHLRRALVDMRDLDALVDRWRDPANYPRGSR
jgi:hypothetical protein